MITLQKTLGKQKFNEKEKEKIKKAYIFATKAHKGQTFGGGSTANFIYHPRFVGYLLSKWNQNSEIVCAGLLHDVVEDSEVSLDTVRRLFGEKTAFYVDGMSWFLSWDNKENKYAKDWPGYYKKFCTYIIQDYKLVIIKAADEWSKQGLPENPKHLIESSGPRAKKFWIPFFKEVGLTKVSALLEWKVNTFIKKIIKSELNQYISKRDLLIIKNKLKKTRGTEEIK